MIDDQVNTFTTSREDKVLKRNWSVISVNDMTRLLLNTANPFSEFTSIRNGSRKENVSNILIEENHSFFPNNTSFLISHIMDFIKNNPSDFSSDFRTSIKHGSKNFSGHNQATSSLINTNITSNQTDILEFLLQFSVFLIGQGLNRRCINNLLLIS